MSARKIVCALGPVVALCALMLGAGCATDDDAPGIASHNLSRGDDRGWDLDVIGDCADVDLTGVPVEVHPLTNGGYLVFIEGDPVCAGDAGSLRGAGVPDHALDEADELEPDESRGGGPTQPPPDGTPLPAVSGPSEGTPLPA